jgi:tetratricopeptide (TPR) repeat protein/transcriptional regulator with XRE-family HTH domain
VARASGKETGGTVTGQPAADFADLLRQLRREARLTQEELAEVAALSLRTIQDLEGRRHRTAHKPTAESLAGALGLTGEARALFVRAATGRASAAEVRGAIAAAPEAGPASTADPASADPATAVPGLRATVPVPRELPADVGAFTGRAAELDELDAFLPTGGEGLPGPVVISAISGTAGAGKTALAVHWAHQMAAHFPDGQLYVNLRGFDPEQPVSAAEALAGFLSALGTPGAEIPLGEAARAARYRSLLTGKRLLVVLDNAATEEQVRPLLPGSPSVMALVTSRATLPGLVARDGARRLDLDLLPGGDAISLLRTLIGDRVEDDPVAMAELARLCARLPLALRVAAELAAARPGMPLAELVAELADERDRLQLLDAGGDPRGAVASVLSWSYRYLPPDAARLFRLLGLHPGQDWDRYAAAALAGTTLSQAGQLLGALARTHLIQPAGPGRYGMHDLLRAYAAQLAAGLDQDGARYEALTRLFDYYQAACAAAMDCLAPAERGDRPDPPPAGTPVPGFGNPDTARSWLDAELATLADVAGHAAGHGWPRHTVGLAQTLYRYFDGGPDAVGLTIYRHALDAARACADHAAEARTLTLLGLLYGRQGRYTQASDCHQQAIALARDAGDRLTQVWALSNLALIHDQQGRYPEAARCNRQAITLYRELGDVTGEAITLGNLGLVTLRQGRYQRAAGHLRQSIKLYRKVGHRFGEAAALTNLGQVRYRLGDYQQAAADQEQALALAQEIGGRRVEAWALTRLGEVRHRQGLHGQAIGNCERALELFREFGDRDGEAEALNGAGETMRTTGQYGQARVFHEAALTLTRETGGRREEARALAGLGEICRLQGQHDQAAAHHQEALDIYREIGDPGGEAEALNGTGETLVATGLPSQARTCFVAALALARQTGDRYQEARAHHGLASARPATGQPDAGRPDASQPDASQPDAGDQDWQQALDIYTGLGVPEAAQMSTIIADLQPVFDHRSRG